MVFQQGLRPSRPHDWRFQVIPRRGHTVAAMKVPRGYEPEDLRRRQPRGVKPRGTPRGGPKGHQIIHRENLEVVCVEAPKGQPINHRPKQDQPTAERHRWQSDKRRGKITETRPTIVTTQLSGLVRRWGLLWRENALRAGCYREDMDRTAKVCPEKDQNRTQVLVETIVR